MSPKVKTADCIVYGEKGSVVEAISFGQELVRKGMTIENSLFDTLEETKEYAKKVGIHKIYVIDKNYDVTEVEI